MNFEATNELLLSILWKIIGQANYPIQNVHQIARFVLYIITYMVKLQDSSFSYVCNAALKKNKGQPHISMRLFHHHRFKLGPIYKQNYAQGATVFEYKSRGQLFLMKNDLILELFFKPTSNCYLLMRMSFFDVFKSKRIND